MSLFGNFFSKFFTPPATGQENLDYLFKAYAAAFGTKPAESVNMLQCTQEANRFYQLSPTKVMKIVCKEAAKLSLIDYNIGILEANPNSPLYQSVTSSISRLLAKLPQYLEIGLALGGLVFKPWTDGHNNAGISIISPLNFVPTAFSSNGDITEGIFVEKCRRGDIIYTKLEYHHWLAADYCVDTKVYQSKNDFELGYATGLTAVAEWAAINPNVTISNLKSPLFAYFRVPGTNSVDESSPLGISLAASAFDYLNTFDNIFAGMKADMETTRKVIFVNNAALIPINKQAVKASGSANPVFYNNPIPNLIVGINGNADMIKEFNPSCNIKDFKIALQTVLSLIAISCGFSTGYFSFDTRRGVVTATQVESEDSTTICTITAIRSALNTAVESAVNSLTALLQLYTRSQFTFKLQFYARDLSATPYADRERVMQLVRDGLYPLDKYLRDFEGFTEEEVIAFITKQQGQGSKSTGGEGGGTPARQFTGPQNLDPAPNSASAVL